MGIDTEELKQVYLSVLLMDIYKKGYYCYWSEKEVYIFSMKVNEAAELVRGVVDECLKWGFFSKEMYDSYSILTSKGIQSRYKLATGRRKETLIAPEYDLINADNNSVNDYKNYSFCSKSNTESTQKKVKEKKVKEKKVKENSRNRIYNNTSPYYKLAKYFYGQIKNNNPNHKEPNYQKWSNDIRLLIEKDGRSIEDVKYLMHWVQQDNFEMVNVLSPDKLRKRFDQLTMKSRSSYKNDENNRDDPRDKEIALQQWIAEGNNPEDFNWES